VSLSVVTAWSSTVPRRRTRINSGSPRCRACGGRRNGGEMSDRSQVSISPKPRRFDIADAQRRILEHFVWDRGWRRFEGQHETLATMRDAGYLKGRWAKDAHGVIEWALYARNMSLTPTQVVNRTKDVTRRLGWPNLQAGELLYACEKCQGLKPGERIKGLAILGVLDVRRERLDAIEQDDVVREGFPDLDPAGFVSMFCKAMRCERQTLVTRIEFEKLA
jgi:hypothetical protein